MEGQKHTKRGASPGHRFGHSVSLISPSRVILFGGAVADKSYQITNDVFSFNVKTQKWTRVHAKSKNNVPSPRAAHGATAIDNSQVVVFGGAQAQGSVVDNDLHLLKLMNDETRCRWVRVPAEEPRPSSRYGHSMAYFRPFIFLIGGSIGRRQVRTNPGNEPTDEVWMLSIESRNFRWELVDFKNGPAPGPRVYHSSSVLKTSKTSHIILLFGGRGQGNQVFNDLWYLSKEKSRSFRWNKVKWETQKSSGTVGRT